MGALPMVPKVSLSHECRAGICCMKITMDYSVCPQQPFASSIPSLTSAGLALQNRGKMQLWCRLRKARQKLILKWKTILRNPMHTSKRLVLQIYKPRLQADHKEDCPWARSFRKHWRSLPGGQQCPPMPLSGPAWLSPIAILPDLLTRVIESIH